MFRRSKRQKSSFSRKPLRLEALESRHMLSGVVNVITTAIPGDLILQGDASGNSVKFQSAATSPSTGQYLLSSGDGSTLFRLNGAPPTFTSLSVNGISGSVQVDLGAGNDIFDFEAPAVAPPAQSYVQGNLVITNHANQINQINNVTVNGNLFISKSAGAVGYSELDMKGTTVVGRTVVDNQTGGGGGDSLTVIDSCVLEGNTLVNPALLVVNGAGSNVTYVQGSSQVGTSAFLPGTVVMEVDNGDGPSNTNINGTTSGTAEIFGGVVIKNGTTVPLQLSQVFFNNTQILGSVKIDNTDGGPPGGSGGDTNISIKSSRVGSHLTSGGPLVVTNGEGVSQFTMSSSDVPWGLEINNPAAVFSASPWGSTTTITGSTIGSTAVVGALLPGPASPGDSLYVNGSDGTDTVSISTTTIVGRTVLSLGAGENKFTLDSNTMTALTVQTGAGNDTGWLGGNTVQSALTISLGSGADTLSLVNGANTKANTLPDPLLGILSIDGGGGVDTFKHDATNATPGNLLNFEVLVSV